MAGIGTFALGVGAALVARIIAPPLERRARPLLRGEIQRAIVVGQGAQARTAGLREDLEDLAEEARADARRDRARGRHVAPAA